MTVLSRYWVTAVDLELIVFEGVDGGDALNELNLAEFFLEGLCDCLFEFVR